MGPKRGWGVISLIVVCLCPFFVCCLDGRRAAVELNEECVCVCEGGGGRGSKMFELNL